MNGPSTEDSEQRTEDFMEGGKRRMLYLPENCKSNYCKTSVIQTVWTESSSDTQRFAYSNMQKKLYYNTRQFEVRCMQYLKQVYIKVV